MNPWFGFGVLKGKILEDSGWFDSTLWHTIIKRKNHLLSLVKQKKKELFSVKIVYYYKGIPHILWQKSLMRKLLHEKVQKYIMGQIMYKKSVSKYVSLYDLQNILFREENFKKTHYEGSHCYPLRSLTDVTMIFFFFTCGHLEPKMFVTEISTMYVANSMSYNRSEHFRY